LDTERAAIYEAISEIAGSSEPAKAWEKLEKRAGDSVIHYLRFLEPKFNHCHIFLLGLESGSWSASECSSRREEIQKLAEQVEAALKQAREGGASEQGFLFADQIGRYAERAYPAYLLADEEIWQGIRSGREVSLPLSSEEIEALESMRAGRFPPCIIEGRAGSGKSTLLVYYTVERLAAPAIVNTKQPVEVPLLVVTQSASLLEGLKLEGDEDAPQGIKLLVEKLKKRLTKIWEGRQDLKFQPEYYTYHQFALNQLCESSRNRFLERSRKGGWIDFSEFRKLLRGQREKSCGYRGKLSRGITAELAWFTIRSYIKGYCIDREGEERWLAPEDYAESDVVARKDRQISLEVYKEVWNKIWPWYKRLTVACKENEFRPPRWDDLDLAWEVLQNRSETAPTYAVLICDECQDLTRVELAAIFGSLEWVRYNLTELKDPRLPIILAGDAHQTIYPACFRWARVRQDCARAIVQHLPGCKPPLVGVLELRYNYRNPPSIAGLCNGLQWLRQETLGHQSALQKIWRVEDEQPNQRVRRLLISGESNSLDRLIEGGALLLGPEPADPDDEVSREFWRALGIETPPDKAPNYVTPADVKGLELPFIAVVGFGEVFRRLNVSDFWHWRNAAEDERIAEDTRFSVEYFLNRLYVAVSRARNQLWIVETEEGWKAFWEPLQEILSQAGDESITNSQRDERATVGFVWSDGTAYELLGIFGRNFGNLAVQARLAALNENSAEKAELAAYYYALANKPLEKHEMLAYRKYFEGNVLEAAKQMWEIDCSRASDWFREAQAWEEMARRPVTPIWRSQLGKLLLQVGEKDERSWFQESFELLARYEVSSDLAQSRNKGGTKWRIWTQILIDLLQRLSRSPGVPREIKSQAITLLADYEPKDPALTYYAKWHSLLGSIHYQLENYSEAVKHWDNAKETTHAQYFLAKANTTQYPESLTWWESAGEWEKMVSLYEGHAQIDLSASDRVRVSRAYLELGHKIKGLVLRVQIDDESLMKICRDWIWSGNATPEELKHLVDQMFQEFSKGVENVEQSSRWTSLMLDLIFESACDGSNWKVSATHALCHGFRHAANPQAVQRWFMDKWAVREIARLKWPLVKEMITLIPTATRDLIRESWQAQQFHQAARLATIALALIWHFQRSPDERQKPLSGTSLQPGVDQTQWASVPPDTRQTEGIPSWRASFAPYLSLEETEVLEKPPERPTARSLASKAGISGKEGIPINLEFFARLPDKLGEVIEAAVGCVGDGRPDWIVDPWEKYEAPEYEWLYTAVDSLAFEFANVARELVLLGQYYDERLTKRLLLLGRFVEQAPFRRRAINFYGDLLRVAEIFAWPANVRAKVAQCLQGARERRARWRDYLRRGQVVEKSDTFIQRDWRWEEVTIRYIRTGSQIRVSAPTSDEEDCTLRADSDFTVAGPWDYKEYKQWVVSFADWKVFLEWVPAFWELRIRLPGINTRVRFLRKERTS